MTATFTHSTETSFTISDELGTRRYATLWIDNTGNWGEGTAPLIIEGDYAVIERRVLAHMTTEVLLLDESLYLKQAPQKQAEEVWEGPDNRKTRRKREARDRREERRERRLAAMGLASE